MTTPVFFTGTPGGYSWSSSARLTNGPLTRNGSVGNRPALGPGSALLFGKLTTFDVVNFANSMRVVDRAENRAVVEDAVAAADHRLAVGVERVREADARREVVLVDGVVLVAAVNSGLSVSSSGMISRS